MRPIMSRSIAILFFSSVLASGAGAQKPKKASSTPKKPPQGLVVMPFSPSGEMMEKLQRSRVVSFGLELSDKLVQSLVDFGYKEVRNAKDLTLVLKQQNLLDKGIIAEDTSVKIGRIMGAKYIVNSSFTGFKESAIKAKAPFGVQIPGSYEGIDAEVKLFVTLIDMETGKTEFTSEVVGSKKDKSVKVDVKKVASGFMKDLEMTDDRWFSTQMGEASQAAVRNAARAIVAHLTNIATAVYIPREDIVVIDKGESDGIKVGDRYQILKIKQTMDGREVVFEEYVPVGNGEVTGINAGRSKLKVDWTWTNAEKRDRNLKLIAKPTK